MLECKSDNLKMMSSYSVIFWRLKLNRSIWLNCICYFVFENRLRPLLRFSSLQMGSWTSKHFEIYSSRLRRKMRPMTCLFKELVVNFKQCRIYIGSLMKWVNLDSTISCLSCNWSLFGYMLIDKELLLPELWQEYKSCK